MPTTMSSFTCPNKHSFEANAKLRARCPECGVLARRDFTPKTEPDPKLEPIKQTEPKKPILKKPVLLRQGRPRMPVKRMIKPHATQTKTKATVKSKPRPTVTKVAAGLVTTHTVKARGVRPTIKRRPVKTAIARGIKGHEQVKPFWHGVADKYGF
jgi:hypothetical protein